jgi:hypothetical protein
MNTPIISPEDLTALYRELDATKLALKNIDLWRKRLGIRFAFEPVELSEIDAVKSIVAQWKDENFEGAYTVLRQYVATHNDLNSSWAYQMVKAANAKSNGLRIQVTNLTSLLQEASSMLKYCEHEDPNDIEVVCSLTALIDKIDTALATP